LAKDGFNIPLDLDHVPNQKNAQLRFHGTDKLASSFSGDFRQLRKRRGFFSELKGEPLVLYVIDANAHGRLPDIGKRLV
jgi:hypothetical protein